MKVEFSVIPGENYARYIAVSQKIIPLLKKIIQLKRSIKFHQVRHYSLIGNDEVVHGLLLKIYILKVPAEVCKYLETLSRVVWNSDDLSQGEPDLVADQVVVEVLRPQLNPHEVLLDPLGQVLALAVRVETLQQFSRVSPHKF